MSEVLGTESVGIEMLVSPLADLAQNVVSWSLLPDSNSELIVLRFPMFVLTGESCETMLDSLSGKLGVPVSNVCTDRNPCGALQRVSFHRAVRLVGRQPRTLSFSIGKSTDVPAA